MAHEPGRSDPATQLPQGVGIDKRQAARLVLAGVLLALALVFMVQNNKMVKLKFVFFSVTTRLWVGLLVAVVIGALLGQLAEVLWHRRRRRG